MTTLPAFQSDRERTIWVQAALRMAGKSFASIARGHGWSRGSVAQAMRTPSDPQERAIAEALGVTQRELFPERYDREGQRLHYVRQPTAGEPSAHVKNHEAA